MWETLSRKAYQKSTSKQRFQPAKFNWTSREKSGILSAYFPGSIFTFLGGLVVHRLGGAKTVGIASVIVAVIELSSPFLFRAHIVVYMVGRTLIGLVEVSEPQLRQKLLFS